MFARTLKSGLTVTALIVGTGLACAFDAPPVKTPPKTPAAPKTPVPAPPAAPVAPTAPARPSTGDTTSMAVTPDAVKEAAEKFFGSTHYVIHNVIDDGVTWYAATGSKDGDHCSLKLTDNGIIAESRKSLDKDQLPDVVRDSIRKMYPSAKFEDMESVSKHYYHIELTVDGKKQEVKVFGNGQPVHDNVDERKNH